MKLPNETAIGLIGILIFIMYIVTVIMICSQPAQAQTIEDIESFLVNDTTDTHEWFLYYSCGHFSRELSYNASLQNITIGSVILGTRSDLGGYTNHIMNYIIIENIVYLIEPQTDEVSMLNQTMYNYYRLYPDGTHVPSNWCHNLATKIVSLPIPVYLAI